MRSFLLYLSMVMLMTQCGYKGEEVDLIVHNAKIYTGKTDMRTHQALAVRDGKIVAIGAEREIMNAYTADEMIDAGKKPVYPIFIDKEEPVEAFIQLVSGVEGFELSREDALMRLTQWEARDQFIEKEKGTLEKGKDADFMILNGNLLTLPLDRLNEVHIESMYKKGKQVH